MKTFLSLLLLFYFLLQAAYAQTDKKIPRKEALMEIRHSADFVEIRLLTPVWNLVGFEQSPVTNREYNRVEEALSILERPAGLFRPDKLAQCECDDYTIHSELFINHVRSILMPNVPVTDDFDPLLDARYYFHCNSAVKLKTLDILIMDHFPAIEVIQVRTWSGDREIRQMLTGINHVVRFLD